MRCIIKQKALFGDWILRAAQVVTALTMLTSIAQLSLRCGSRRNSLRIILTAEALTVRKNGHYMLRSRPPCASFIKTGTAQVATHRGQASNPTSLQPAFLQGLNSNQCQAVTQPLHSITRVVAGPGSGKTKVLTCRIAYLLQQDPLARILGVTFTRKAAAEMQHRLERLLSSPESSNADMAAAVDSDGISENSDLTIEENPQNLKLVRAPGLERVTLGTFHSVCARILRMGGELLCTLPSVTRDTIMVPNKVLLDSNFVIIDEGEQLRLIREFMPADPLAEIKPVTILNAISRVKSLLARGIDPFSGKDKENGLRYDTRTIALIREIYMKYREHLFTSNSLDFDDLIEMTRELLFENTDIRQRLHNRWTHILVDEFQDTSQTQIELVKLLTTRSLFVVGDADQSIYSWRGAHAFSLQDLSNEFESIDTVHLTENYRSTSAIVKAAQKVICSAGGDTLRQSMEPKREAGKAPRVVACHDAKSEAEFVVETVKAAISSGEYTPNRTVAIIYRTNAQSRALEEACVKQNLPYVIFGSATSFYKRQEVKDCLCFLRWLHNGRDRGSMLRAFITPKRGIGDSAIGEFDSLCEMVDKEWQSKWGNVPGPTPLDVLLSFSGPTEFTDRLAVDHSSRVSSRFNKLFTKFSQQIRNVHTYASKATVGQVLARLIEELELMKHFDKISKSRSEFEERKSNVEELRRAAEKYVGPCLSTKLAPSNLDEFEPTPLGEFLDDVALVADVSSDADTPDTIDRLSVSLMTIHASKGMEFDTVFVVGNEEGTLPLQTAILEGTGSVALDEEKRLCYVAMTRAKSELIMTWRKEATIFTNSGTQTAEKQRSRFLDVLLTKKNNADVGRSKRPFDNGNLLQRRVIDGSYKERSIRNGRSLESNNIQPSRRNLSTRADDNFLRTTRRPTSTSRFTGANVKPSILGFERYRKESSQSRPTATQTSDFVRKPENRYSNLPLPRVKATLPPSMVGQAHPRPTSKGDSAINKGSVSRSNPRNDTGNAAMNDQKVKERKDHGRPIDSTWFFPVGSEVSHKKFGNGIVLSPVPVDGLDLPVRVKFENGDSLDFSAHGSDLSPVIR